MARGLATLSFKRRLLNPAEYGIFSFMLFSHKLCRWLVQLTFPLAVIGVTILAFELPWATPIILSGALVVAAIAALAWWWPSARPMSGVLSAPGYLLWSNVAGLAAWIQYFRGRYQSVWEPTRRPDVHG